MRRQIFVFDILKEVGCHSMEEEREKTFLKKREKKGGSSLAKKNLSRCISMMQCKQEKDRNFLKERLQKSFVMESFKQLKSRHC